MPFLCLRPSQGPLDKIKPQVTRPNPHLHLTPFEAFSLLALLHCIGLLLSELLNTTYLFLRLEFSKTLWIFPRLALRFHSDLFICNFLGEVFSECSVLRGFLLLLLSFGFPDFLLSFT